MKRFTKLRQTVGWLGLALLPLALVLTGCKKSGAGGPPEPPPTEVEIRVVSTAPVEDVLGSVGTIEANEIVEVKTEVPGLIAAIHFTEGKRASRGDRLFELKCAKEAAQLSLARAEEEVAQQNLERARKLAGTKAISQQELDQLASQVAARGANRRLQEERVKDMTIVAPFAGVVGPRRVSVGQYIDSGQSLVTLVDSSRVKISYRIPERNLGRFKVGQDVRLVVGAYAGKVFPATIDLINPVVDEATRTTQIRAVAENPDDLLKPGMFARVETVLDRRASAVVMPETALVPALNGFSVYVLKGGVARLSPVKLGVRGRGNVEITEGLTVGQEIVVEGTQKLVDGMKVVAARPSSGTNRLSQQVTAAAGPAGTAGLPVSRN